MNNLQQISTRPNLQSRVSSPTRNGNMNPQLQFQKNYPKNVFIPLIQYLAEKGYKQAYEECVGTREEIERKNVVSLDMIFNLTRQAWFQRNIDKHLLLVNISNKILMNSKIKKKLFHLLIAQYILLEDISSEIKEFKKKISRVANQISQKNLPVDQVFQYSNSIIYLLTIFLRAFKSSIQQKGLQKLDEQFNQLKLSDDISIQKVKPQGSKQEYKYLVKEIVILFAKKNLTLAQLTDAFEEIKNTITAKANSMRQVYSFVQNVPNWKDFVQIVVMKCFQNKRKDNKITNMTFNQLINQYKVKTISINDQAMATHKYNPSNNTSKQLNSNSKQFNSTQKQLIISIRSDRASIQEMKERQKFNIRTFSPIILTKYCQKKSFDQIKSQ